MSDQPTGTIPPVTPVTSLEDPRVVSILSTEHWNLLSNRSLAYNEALTRGGMFLTSLSMSFVALALLAQALGFSDQFLIVAALVLAFDLVIGLTTYGRILGANLDDLRAVHGMARIRQAYVRIAPAIVPFLTSPSNDDPRSVMRVYGDSPSTFPATLFYALTTSGGMIGLITSISRRCPRSRPRTAGRVDERVRRPARRARWRGRRLSCPRRRHDAVRAACAGADGRRLPCPVRAC
jgi:hypothetical protein